MLSDKQIDFLLNSTADINIASGSIRSGKTFVQNIRFLEYLENEALPNIDILISGKKGDAVERNVINPLLDIIEAEGILFQFEYNRAPRRLTYRPKNIKCYVEGANDEGAEPRIRGMTIQALLGDEVTLFPRSFFMQAVGRCSAGKRLKLLSCNPDAPSHYIQEEVIRKIQNNEVNGKIWYFGLEDNPVLDPDYIEQIKALYTGVFYERFIEGKWVQAEGVIYDKFNRKLHLIKDYPREQIQEYLIGIDWGYENPLVLLLIAVDYDGCYYVIDEIYEKHQLIDNSLHVKIKNHGWFDLLRGDMRMPISYAYGDPSRPDYIQTFYQLTRISTIPAVNDVIEGIQNVQQHFILKKVYKDKPPVSRLYINEKCYNTIKEFESYRWKTDRSGVGKDEVIKDNDHCMDALRYALHTHSRKARRLAINPFKGNR